MRSLAVVLLCCLGVARSSAAAEQVIKIATLAPEGSTWWKLFQEADKRVHDATQGRVQIKLYAGGVAGDEPDFIRKMRVGSLQGAGITNGGLAEVQPALMALQAPGVFQTWDELDVTREKLSPRLQALLAEKGFFVLFWGDVGFNNVFSNLPIHTPDDLKKTKSWLWTQDNVFRNYFDVAGVKAVPLGLPDVLASLTTGLIDTLSTPPLAAVSLQWFTKAKYMLDLQQSATVGAVVLTTKSLDKLTPADRDAVIKVGHDIGLLMRDQVRQDNARAVEAIKKAGIQVIVPTAQEKAAWAELAERANAKAVGTVYPKELMAEIKSTVADLRKK